MAQTLEEGRPCPVCGSPCHPTPAQLSSHAPTEAQLDQAKADMEAAQRRASEKSLAAGEKKAALEERERQLLAQIEKRLQETEGRLARKQELEVLIPKKESDLKTLEQAVSATREEMAGEESRRAEIASQLETLQAELRYPDAAAAQTKLTDLETELVELNRTRKAAEETYNTCKTELTGTDRAIQELISLLENSEKVDEELQQTRSRELKETRAQTAETQRTVHTRLTTNRTALENIRRKAADLESLKNRYTWVRTLSNTVNGNLPGREKIALETYIQMTFFDRILRRANLRLLVMSGGQYELKRQREADIIP